MKEETFLHFFFFTFFRVEKTRMYLLCITKVMSQDTKKKKLRPTEQHFLILFLPSFETRKKEACISIVNYLNELLRYSLKPFPQLISVKIIIFFSY